MTQHATASLTPTISVTDVIFNAKLMTFFTGINAATTAGHLAMGNEYLAASSFFFGLLTLSLAFYWD